MAGPENSLDVAEASKLVRAAIAYDGRTLRELAALTNISVPSLRNYTSRSRPTYANLETRLVIARATGFPDWVMTTGFTESPGEAREDVERRLRLVEDDFRHLAAQVAALVAAELRRTEESQPASADLPREQHG